MKTNVKFMGQRAFFAVLGSLFLLSAGSVRAETFEGWMDRQYQRSSQGLFSNISPAGTERGVVIASPSRGNPDYFYHWTRDAGLVMETVLARYESTSRSADKSHLFKLLADYVAFSRENQTADTPWGLGEAKFFVDGKPYYIKGWNNPQNDGPAIRANALIRLARVLIREGKTDWVRRHLYSNEIPAHTVIKADLEFVSHHWKDDSYDLWEEIKGTHFYTLMVQRRALITGASLAADLGDATAAHWYRSQAAQISSAIDRHWSAQQGYLLATRDRTDGNPNKTSQLDAAVVLAVLHGNTHDGFYSPGSDRVLLSALKIQESFQRVFPINSALTGKFGALGTAIGRYPEDDYDGYGNGKQGHGWFLTTAGFAELYYAAANEWQRKGRIKVTPALKRGLSGLRGFNTLALRDGETLKRGTSKFTHSVQMMREIGDQYLRRVHHHAAPDGSLSEQFNRHTGYMQGAHDLTWSYSAFMTAMDQRRKTR